jgi:broad specificity phosphatase PhoE
MDSPSTTTTIPDKIKIDDNGYKSTKHSHHRSKKEDHIDDIVENNDDDDVIIVQIVLIRHGKSQAQGATSVARKKDASLTDARLSTEGIIQATNLTPIVAKNVAAIDLVITSPLSRALQTTQIIFEPLGKEKKNKVIVHDLFRELNSNHHSPIPENKGRPLHSIQQDFAEFNFSHVSEVWPEWRPGLERDGLSVLEALEWLAIQAQERELKRIVVVAHHNWICCALSNDHRAHHVQIENAEPIYTVLCRQKKRDVGDGGGDGGSSSSSSRRSLRLSPIQLKLWHRAGFSWFT